MIGDQPFPFTRPDGSDADMFIQWKGTDVCLDFYCPCGTHSHLDGDFAYFVRCRACGAVYQMGTQVIARRLGPDDDAYIPPKDLMADDEIEVKP